LALFAGTWLAQLSIVPIMQFATGKFWQLFAFVADHTRWWVTLAFIVPLISSATSINFIVFFLAAIANAVLGKTLKHIIGQARPVSSSRQGPGMPSSHAMSLFFIATYAGMFAWPERPFFVPLSKETHSLTLIADAIEGITASAPLVLASVLSWWRVKRKLHTEPQVLVGAALGTTNAYMMKKIEPNIIALLEGTLALGAT
jgi:dolichyldiphosphatase